MCATFPRIGSGSTGERLRNPASIALRATVRLRKTSTCSGGCEKGNSRTVRVRCAQKSIWPRRTSICAIRSCTASSERRITVRARRGASIPCTIGRMGWKTQSNIYPIRSVPLNTKTTGRSTIGSSISSPFTIRGRSNSRVST